MSWPLQNTKSGYYFQTRTIKVKKSFDLPKKRTYNSKVLTEDTHMICMIRVKWTIDALSAFILADML